MWIIFLATVNKCTATIMIIIIVNVKSFLERHFSGISISIFKNNLTFIKKLYCTLMHYKARQVLLDLFNTNQENSSETIFVTRATKSTSKFENLAMIRWLNERNNLKALYRDGRFEPLANSARSLTWAYKLKALKSSS